MSYLVCENCWAEDRNHCEFIFIVAHSLLLRGLADWSNLTMKSCWMKWLECTAKTMILWSALKRPLRIWHAFSSIERREVITTYKGMNHFTIEGGRVGGWGGIEWFGIGMFFLTLSCTRNFFRGMCVFFDDTFCLLIFTNLPAGYFSILQKPTPTPRKNQNQMVKWCSPMREWLMSRMTSLLLYPVPFEQFFDFVMVSIFQDIQLS